MSANDVGGSINSSLLTFKWITERNQQRINLLRIYCWIKMNYNLKERLE